MGSPGPATTMHVRDSFTSDEILEMLWGLTDWIGQLDYVLRPSWQAQIRGKKLWTLKPPPECESICHDVNITVESGDIGTDVAAVGEGVVPRLIRTRLRFFDSVLIDTTAWYHATQVLPEGGLSIAIGCGYD